MCAPETWYHIDSDAHTQTTQNISCFVADSKQPHLSRVIHHATSTKNTRPISSLNVLRPLLPRAASVSAKADAGARRGSLPRSLHQRAPLQPRLQHPATMSLGSVTWRGACPHTKRTRSCTSRCGLLATSPQTICQCTGVAVLESTVHGSHEVVVRGVHDGALQLLRAHQYPKNVSEGAKCRARPGRARELTTAAEARCFAFASRAARASTSLFARCMPITVSDTSAQHPTATNLHVQHERPENTEKRLRLDFLRRFTKQLNNSRERGRQLINASLHRRYHLQWRAQHSSAKRD